MSVILSTAKNLTCEGQMLRLWLSMTIPQIACDRAVGLSLRGPMKSGRGNPTKSLRGILSRSNLIGIAMVAFGNLATLRGLLHYARNDDKQVRQYPTIELL